MKLSLLLLALGAGPASAIPFTKPATPPVPVVIWHGLGDRYDAGGLASLKEDIQGRADLEGVFVHMIQIGEDGQNDQRATFFGNANAQVDLACDQLRAIEEITSPALNPSGKFDGIGFSQGGQLLRALAERCGGAGGLNLRHLVTFGSQHMGISALPACPPGSSPFSSCRLMHLSLVREGLYSAYAQRNIVPAQYFRDEARIDTYLNNNAFLRDINNERTGDEQVGPVPEERRPRLVGELEGEPEPRNATYRNNLAALDKLVLLRFSKDTTVVPPQSAHFTLPSPNATNCDPLADAACYLDPVPWADLPLYKHDYIGLRALDERGAVVRGSCEGEHMQISDDCWESAVAWLGDRKGRKTAKQQRPSSFVIQL